MNCVAFKQTYNFIIIPQAGEPHTSLEIDENKQFPSCGTSNATNSLGVYLKNLQLHNDSHVVNK
jgi:hypothetical protein